MIKLIKKIINHIDCCVAHAAEMGVQPVDNLKFQED
jgi:hypothetical protein